MLKHLHHVRWSLAEDLAAAVGRPVAKVRQRLSLLKANGLVAYDRPTLGAAAWRVTSSGQAIADLDGPVAQPLRAFSWTHTVTVSALSAALAAEAVEHRVDHQLKSEVARCRRAQREPREVAVPAFDRWQVPDLLIALADDRRLAIELELSMKASKRIQTVLSAYAISDWQVIYLARPSVARTLERELEGRQAFAEKRIEVWPAPVLEATETKPARPYGEAARGVAREIRGIVDASHRPIVDPAPPLAGPGNPQAPAGRWGRR
jgi:hypothetical protein